MDARARLRFYRGSPSKVRPVADMVRGQQVDGAIRTLQLSPKYAARDLEKLVRSALANLEEKIPSVDRGKVYVERIVVDEGPRLKRGRAASKWVRWHRILKRMCHITVDLAVRDN